MQNIILYFIPLLTVGLAYFTAIKTPSWADDHGMNKKWVNTTLVILPLALAAGFMNVYFSDDKDFVYRLALVNSTTVLSYIALWGLITDVKHRKVDRRLLFAATLMTLASSVAWLVSHKDYTTQITFVIVLLFGCFARIFFKELKMGASDARAFILIGTAAVPVLGYFGFMWGVIFMGISFIAFGMVTFIAHRSLKISQPAVPLLLIPYLIMILISQFVTFSL